MKEGRFSLKVRRVEEPVKYVSWFLPLYLPLLCAWNPYVNDMCYSSHQLPYVLSLNLLSCSVCVLEVRSGLVWTCYEDVFGHPLHVTSFNRYC